MNDHRAVPLTLDAELPGDRAGHAFDLVRRWMFSAPMTALLSRFGTTSEPTSRWLHHDEDLPGWLDALAGGTSTTVEGLGAAEVETLRRTLAIERVAAGSFNFRTDGTGKYVERSNDGVPASADHVALSDALGLVSASRPRHDRYDKTLILGGGYASPLLRARFAADLRDSGIDLGQVSLLGSPRFLQPATVDPDGRVIKPAEAEATRSYAPGATDEFDLMIGAVRQVFGATASEPVFLCGCDSADEPCPQWKCKGAEHADETPAAFTHERSAALSAVGTALSASTGRPPIRPDTSDTFALWARVADPRPGERVLVLTTQIFVPFQTFEGLRRLYLPFGIDVDTIGYGAEWGDRKLTKQTLLQETLSAIRSGRRLLVSAAEERISKSS